MNGALRKWWPLPLRILVGVGFFCHGFPKLFTASGHAAFTGVLQQLDVPFPDVAASIAGIVEFFGGLAVLEGAFFSVATGLLIVDMLAAMLAMYLRQGLGPLRIIGISAAGPPLGMPGAEVNLLYVAALLALFIGGAGPLSVAEAMAHRARPASPSAPPREVHA
jgi:putative oxidoreductase